MPLFVFIVLGLIQLALMHQARLMTKYAAYKAVRAGSVNRADMMVMENAAVAVMLPLLTEMTPIAAGNAEIQPQYRVYRISNATEYASAYNDATAGRDNTAFAGKRMVEVTVCHPTVNEISPDEDFDDYRTNPMGNAGDWTPYEATKLSIQVTTYLNLYIPYANAFLWWAAYGELSGERLATMKRLRLAQEGGVNVRREVFSGQSYTLEELRAEAERGNYVMPIRGSYSMRMHSNISQNSNLPDMNECHVPMNR